MVRSRREEKRIECIDCVLRARGSPITPPFLTESDGSFSVVGVLFLGMKTGSHLLEDRSRGKNLLDKVVEGCCCC